MAVNTSETLGMKRPEIVEKAKELGINPYQKSNAQLLTLIAEAEKNHKPVEVEYAPGAEDEPIAKDAETAMRELAETKAEIAEEEKTVEAPAPKVREKSIDEMTDEEILQKAAVEDAREKLRKIEDDRRKKKTERELAEAKINMASKISKEPLVKVIYPFQEGKPEYIDIKVNGIKKRVYADEETMLPLCHAEVLKDSLAASRKNYHMSKRREAAFLNKTNVIHK